MELLREVGYQASFKEVQQFACGVAQTMTFFRYADIKKKTKYDRNFVLSHVIPKIRSKMRSTSYQNIMLLEIPPATPKFSLGPAVLLQAIQGKSYVPKATEQSYDFNSAPIAADVNPIAVTPPESLSPAPLHDVEIEIPSPAPVMTEAEKFELFEFVEEAIKSGKQQVTEALFSQLEHVDKVKSNEVVNG